MHMTPYRRNNSLFSLIDEMERSVWGDSVSGATAFRTDITEKDGKYTLEAELLGFDAKDINVELNDNTLTISAQNEVNNDKKDENGNYIRRERRYGSFSRSFDVSGIDTDKIHADYQNGVLKLVLPKREETQPKSRRIEIGKQQETQQEIPLETQQSDAPVQ